MIALDPPAPVSPVTIGIVDKLRANARATPAAPALVCDGTTLSWGAFEDRQNRVANLLLSAGLARGGRVAVLSPNSIAYAEVFVGTLRAGGCI